MLTEIEQDADGWDRYELRLEKDGINIYDGGQGYEYGSNSNKFGLIAGPFSCWPAAREWVEKEITFGHWLPENDDRQPAFAF